MMAKRQRISAPPWWDEIVGEVTGNGGYLHRGITFLPESRSIVCEAEIDEKTLVFKIPRSSILSAPSGCDQYAWIQELRDKTNDRCKAQNAIADLILAYRLAGEDPTYLKTLPPPSSWNLLPRRWTEETLQKCLGGSPLMERIKKQKSSVTADYRLLCNHPKGKGGPTFEAFDDMLAAVTSRAFAGAKDEIMMIPILDLCNHARGKDEKKNLEYKILDDGSVEVSATAKIAPHEHFRLTYGAKGNSQLLLNYGFAMKHNLETDGSSNDFLEFSFDGAPAVELRTGPKDYTYGKFIKILEQILGESSASLEEEEEDDDMNAFLDGTDEMEEMDIYGAASADEVPEDTEQNEEIENELEALKKLKQVIHERIDAYGCKGSKLRDRLECQDGSIDYFSSLLVLSEQRCLFFYFLCAEKVGILLQNKDLSTLDKADGFKDVPINDEDLSLIDKQTSELANVFMTIRHGNGF
ncbi:unnamed protein product [Cylindrotheca closterium]|uniref:SET domain-containing protein n=1 Tax=Cylindrotheca closterium TaxID=2856 RepID=A0AAD2FQU4_9STRA|nr:unnamed protein product [Cylindrotheca closterium]